MFYFLNFVGMKSILKKCYSLGLLLLWMFLVIWFISMANWSITIINTAPDDSEHKVTLHSLYLSGNSDEILLWTTTGMESLRVFNWLIASSGGDIWGATLSSDVWWFTNKMIGGGFWLGIWWFFNKVKNWLYAAIGGGDNNMAIWKNSVIVWWSQGKAYTGWVVLWWLYNEAGGWVILWWRRSQATWENSLVLWYAAKWHENSFARSGEAQPNKARINANSGVLIWTVNPIDGVSLVVSWSVKLSKWTNITWSITLNDSWCITVYDWKSSHALGNSSESTCGVASWCQFGSTFLQNWDVVTGYMVSYDNDCGFWQLSAKCDNWKIKSEKAGWYWAIYPYCYNVDNPNIKGVTLTKWDVNGDGVVMLAQDCMAINDYILGHIDRCPPSCDLNGDGQINNADINLCNDAFWWS